MKIYDTLDGNLEFLHCDFDFVAYRTNLLIGEARSECDVVSDQPDVTRFHVKAQGRKRKAAPPILHIEQSTDTAPDLDEFLVVEIDTSFLQLGQELGLVVDLDAESLDSHPDCLRNLRCAEECETILRLSLIAGYIGRSR